MIDVSDALTSLVHAAEAVDSPHLDVGPLLGLNGSLKVAVTDVHALLGRHPEAPGLRLSWDGGQVTVQHHDGTTVATLAVRW